MLSNKIKCRICGLECSMQIPSSHLRVAHSMTTKEYKALGYKTLSPARLHQLQDSDLAKGEVKRHYGEDHHNYKGGCIDTNGYRIVYVRGKRVVEHRHIMEQYLGRSLKQGENIHHTNGDKTDNRLENLQILSTAEHSSLEGKKRYKKTGKTNFNN